MIGKMVAMLLADRTRWERLPADPTPVRTAVPGPAPVGPRGGRGLRRRGLTIADGQ